MALISAISQLFCYFLVSTYNSLCNSFGNKVVTCSKGITVSRPFEVPSSSLTCTVTVSCDPVNCWVTETTVLCVF